MVEVKTDGVSRRRRARIPSWLEVAPSLHSEAAYIEADHFFHQKILLAIRRRTIHRDPYNPAQLRKQTAQSTVYREERRELAVGERIQLAVPDKQQGIRSGVFATVERIENDNALALRLDNGKTLTLNSETARHIEYGYVVDGAKRAFADRVLATGESLDPAALAAISLATRDLAIYTSDGFGLEIVDRAALGRSATMPIERDQGFGLGL